MAEGLNADRPQKLSIVVFSGAFDKVHYALVMASAAAATDTPVTLFFTMEGARALLPADGTAALPWRDLPTEVPGRSGGDLDDAFKARNIADFETLLAACRDLGVRFMVCEMGLKALDIERENLRHDLTYEIGGVVTFLNDAQQDGAVVFV
jgi:peroxiredoxin family protein